MVIIVAIIVASPSVVEMTISVWMSVRWHLIHGESVPIDTASLPDGECPCLLSTIRMGAGSKRHLAVQCFVALPVVANDGAVLIRQDDRMVKQAEQLIDSLGKVCK